MLEILRGRDFDASRENFRLLGDREDSVSVESTKMKVGMINQHSFIYPAEGVWPHIAVSWSVNRLCRRQCGWRNVSPLPSGEQY